MDEDFQYWLSIPLPISNINPKITDVLDDNNEAV